MIKFTIDDREVEGKEGWTILEVARWNGIEIPTLCYHPAVESAGACRLCVVEVDDGSRSRVVTSCIYPLEPGIKVRTNTERIINIRRWILQLLIDQCPGSEKLKELGRSYGIEESRYKSEKSEEACILCGLCVRVCKEIIGVSAITFGNRGIKKEITTPYREISKDCAGCGTCLYICPTGAMEKFYKQFRARQQHASF